MRKNLIIAAAIAACIIALLLLRERLFPPKEIRLDQTNKTFVVNGDVKIKKAGGGAGWQEMDTSTVLEEGDVIETAENSSADVIIGRDAEKAVRIKEKTRIEFERINPARLNCMNGKVMVTLKNLEPNSSFVVKTPVAVSGAHGTGFSIEAAPDMTTICVFEHEVFAYCADSLGRQLAKQCTVPEGNRCTLLKNKRMEMAAAISDSDYVYWKRWEKTMALLREGKLLVNDFDRKENFNNLDGGFGSWNVFYGDPTQHCQDEQVTAERAGDTGYGLKLAYDVDSENSAYNGFFTKLRGVDLTDYKYLVFSIKGDKSAGFTTKVTVELKDKYVIGRMLVDDITDEWKREVLPINKFVGLGTVQNMKELVIVFSDIVVTKKEGVVYIDDIYFSKERPAG